MQITNYTHFRIAMGDKEGHSELPSGSGHTESKTMKITKPIQISITVEGNEVSTPDAKKGSDDDFKKELEKAGLDSSHWSGVLKDKLRVTSSHALEHIGDDALSDIPEAKDWEKEALRKLGKRVKKKSEPSPQKSVETELKKAGLDPDYWSKVLKDELGVTTLDELDHIGDESYSKLAKKTRHNWEKNALRKLFKMETKETKSERVEKRQAEAAQLLNDLKTLQNEGKERNDKVVQDMERGVREKLNVSDDEWISKDTTLDETIRKLEARHNEISGTLKARTDISEKAVVQSASSGRALEGVLWTNDHDDLDIRRHAVLKVPEDISLDGPSDAHHDIIKQFEEKTKEDRYTKRIDKHGYSVSASAKGGFWGVSVEASTSYSHSTESEETKGHQEEDTYSSIVKYSILPLASCSFKDYQFQLSDDAVAHLQRLEKASGSIQLAQESENFLRKFGSHVYTGPLHFGGRYRWKSYTSGFKKEDKSTVQKLQSEAITVTVGVSYGSVAGASASTSVSSLKGKFEGEYKEDLLTQTFLEVKITGGPPEVTGLPDWKTGMVASNSTWCLIDRGTEGKPIWDIIEMNHAKDFKNSSLIAKNLKRTWEKIILNSQQREVAEELKHVTLWSHNPDPAHFEDQLALLVDKKHIVGKTNFRMWPTDYLSYPPLQQYLRLVVESLYKSELIASGQSNQLKRYLRQLVEPIDLDVTRVFPNQESIRKWLHSPTELPQVDCHDFASFKEALENMDCVKVDTASALPHNSVIATATVARAVFCLRKHLNGQKYEDIFFITILFPFKFNPKKHRFAVLMTIQDIKYLCENFEMRFTQFSEIKETEPLNLLRLQSYLFLLTIELYNKFDISERRIKCHIKYLEQAIGKEMKTDLACCLAEAQSNCNDWDWLLNQLKVLINDAPTIQVKVGVTIEQILSQKAEVPKEQSTPQKYTLEAKEEFFRQLGLREYYPQQLSLSHALQIREDSLSFRSQSKMTKNVKQRSEQARTGENKKETNLQPDPLAILRNIISFLVHSNIESDKDTCTSPVSDLESELALHPRDSLLALLHCSDNFLRQDLMSRLATCQLAVPLLLPDPITREPTFLLWALRTIVKEFRVDEKSISYTCPIVSHRAPFVTFLQIGKHSKSKSQLLNAVIGASEHMPFFQSCSDSEEEALANGLVEVSWHSPTENSIFSDAVTFANLHGDAREHPLQIDFLGKVSCMHFVLLNEEDYDEGAKQVLEDLSIASGCIVILQKEQPVRTPSRGIESVRKSGWKESLRQKPKQKIILENKFPVIAGYEHQINEIQKLIQGEISKRRDHYTLEEMKDIAHDIQIDENESECVVGKTLADEVISEIKRFTEANPHESPKKLLALQSRDLWHKWAQQDREQYEQSRMGQMPMCEYVALHRKQMVLIREKQFCLTQSLSPVMKAFLEPLLKHKHQGTIIRYYLSWLQCILENQWREQLSPLNDQNQKKQRELDDLQLREKRDKTAERICGDELKELTIELKDASLGVEHLFREMCQIYEAIISQEGGPQSLTISRLPEVAAQLLIDGFPLELIDGDAAHIPKTWVSAVLSKVSDILSNPQIFVVSLLDLSDKGKSTILNAVFGVQFGVVAGRCSRGACIQLLPVHSALQRTCGFQYFLLISTQGLKSSELDTLQMRKYGRELAAFVISIANLTIINSEEEVEMHNSLQITVHALLRMRQLKLKPSCFLAYQNTVASTADVTAAPRHSQIENLLNEMTLEAAKAEGLEAEYRYFRQVISLDYENDVFHFPPFSSKANSALAPISSNYSVQADILKCRLINFAKRLPRNCHHSVLQLKQCVEVLWKAILQENFVFSVKNTREIATYNKVEAEYEKWSWRFKDHMLHWEQSAENRLMTCKYDVLDGVYEELIETLPRLFCRIYCDAENEMARFFSPAHEVTLKWKDETEIRLKMLNDQLQTQAEYRCKELLFLRSSGDDSEADRRKQQIHSDISERVQQLAFKVVEKGEELNRSQLKDIFIEHWILWITELTASLPYREFIEVKSDVEKELTESFSPYYKLLMQRLYDVTTGKPLDKWGRHLGLQVKEVHIKLMSEGSNVRDVLPLAQEHTNVTLKEVQKYLTWKQRSAENYSPSFTVELLLMLLNNIIKLHSQKFVFTVEYKVDMALTTCGYAMRIFEKMAEACMKNYHSFEYETHLTTFTDDYDQILKVEPFAQTVCDRLENPIRKQAIYLLSKAIVEDCLPKFKDKKTMKGRIFLDTEKQVLCQYQGIAPMLILMLMYPTESHVFDNGKEEVIIIIAEEVRNPTRTLHNWIMHYTEEHCDSGNPSRLCILATKTIREVITRFKVTVQSVSQSFLSMTKEFHVGDWLTEFCRALNSEMKLEIKPRELYTDDWEEAQCFKNVILFAEEIIRKLTKLQTKLVDEKKDIKVSEINTWKQKPYDDLFNKLCGCTARCPFCKEQCDNPEKAHDSKHTTMHRPVFFGDPKGNGNDAVILDTCPLLVTGSGAKHSFYVEGEEHHYKEYSTVYPTWDIPEDKSAEVAMYWKWLVANCTKAVQNVFKVELDDKVPSEWKDLSWEEVKKWLKDEYKLYDL